MNDLQSFENSEFGTVTVNGEVMFIGKDVVDILGYQNGTPELKAREKEKNR